MKEFLFILVALVLGIPFLIAAFNTLTLPVLKKTKVKNLKKMSVLIPARNEEKTLAALFTSLEEQQEALYEILVYDDHSTDGTASVVRSWEKRLPILSRVPVSELPEGWMGKQFACNQLAQHAAGDIYVFADADTCFAQGAIESIAATMTTEDFQLLSVFPKQMHTRLGTRFLVPLVLHWLTLSLAPLRLFNRMHIRGSAIACGQCIAITAQAYHASGGHASCRTNIVDDLCLAQQVRREKLSTAAFFSGRAGLVSAQMYKSFKASWNGFKKNFFAIPGGQIWATPLWIAYISAVVIAFIFSFSNMIFLLLVLVFFLQAAIIGWKAGDNPITEALLHPARIFLLPVLIIVSNMKKTVDWKGRFYEKNVL